MSVIMTEDKTIQTISAYIAAILNDLTSSRPSGLKELGVEYSDFMEAFAECKDSSGNYRAPLIFLELRKLNENAYSERYGEDAFPISEQFVPYEDYREETRHEWQVRLFNAVRFFNYQCDESVNDGNKVFEVMKEFENDLAHAIADFEAEKMGLEWGEF